MGLCFFCTSHFVLPASILGAPVCAPGALGVLVPVAAALRFVLGLCGVENRDLSELVLLWLTVPSRMLR